MNCCRFSGPRVCSRGGISIPAAIAWSHIGRFSLMPDSYFPLRKNLLNAFYNFPRVLRWALKRSTRYVKSSSSQLGVPMRSRADLKIRPMRKQRNPAPDPPKSGEKVPSSSRGAHSSYQEKLARYLIVNADDFGQSTGINKGVIQAHEEGIVTSASLMVRWPAAPEAAAYARNRPGLSVGLHVDL